MVGDSHMDMGEKEKAMPGLQLQQLHIHGEGRSNAVSNVSPADEVAADEILLKFECQMYKSRDDEYLIDIQVRASAIMVSFPCQCPTPYINHAKLGLIIRCAAFERRRLCFP